MDSEKRHELQLALDRALAGQGPVVISASSGKLITLQPDFTCFENHIEGTDEQGAPVKLPYDDIEKIHAADQ
ncbi:MAG: hypothetical protein KIT48_06190 [Pseudolabrys sp.]|nr:hypothetical protein [Pseudolabrys sp.]